MDISERDPEADQTGTSPRTATNNEIEIHLVDRLFPNHDATRNTGVVEVRARKSFGGTVDCACFPRSACHRHAHPTTASRRWSLRERRNARCHIPRILPSTLVRHILLCHLCRPPAVHGRTTTRITMPSLSLRVLVQGSTGVPGTVAHALAFPAVKAGTCSRV